MVETQPSDIIIKGELDRYKAMDISDMTLLKDTEEEFDKQLQANLDKWLKEGARSVTIKFRPPKCHLMNVAANHGFNFHHASPTGYVQMSKWMDPSTGNRIPAFADHYVGVGGVVVNDKDEVLLIQEVKSPDPKPWKFPGGLMDPGETIKAAIEREVLEETGVKTEFQGLLGLREQLEYKFGAADFYIVCLLKPCKVQDIDIQDKLEVCAAKWVPLEDLKSNEEGAPYRMFPNPFKFINSLQQWLKMVQDKKLDLNKKLENKNSAQLIKFLSLSHDVAPSNQKNKLWNYYLPMSMQTPEMQ